MPDTKADTRPTDEKAPTTFEEMERARREAIKRAIAANIAKHPGGPTEPEEK